MKKVKFIAVIGFIVLCIFAFTTCEPEDDDPADPIIGTWRGSLKKESPSTEHKDVTMVFTSSGWTLTSGAAKWNMKGTYSKKGGIYTFIHEGTNDNMGLAYFAIVGSLYVQGNGNNSNNPLKDFDGYFTKVYTPPTLDPFIGTWSGTYTQGSATISDAKLKFETGNKWSISSTANNTFSYSGTYTRSLGFNATLNSNGLTLFTANISIILNSGTLTLSNYPSGIGSFTKDSNP